MSVRSTSSAGVGPPSVRHTPISNQTTRAAKAKEQAEAERSANKPESQPRTDGFGALVSALR
jgi:hypothetical protein